jgi:hypothetical protein
MALDCCVSCYHYNTWEKPCARRPPLQRNNVITLEGRASCAAHNTTRKRNVAADAGDLGYVRLRMARLFAKRPVVPHAALVYRLAEVGPRKFDARELEVTLRALSHTTVGPARPRAAVYADPTRESGEVQPLVEEAVETLVELDALEYAAAIPDLAVVLSRSLGDRKRPRITPVDPAGARFDSPGALNGPRASAVWHVTPPRGTPILCWVSDDLPWIYPDDPRLWRLLSAAAEAGASPLLVARKVAPITYPLCKALGAFALQYYAPIVAHELDSDLLRRVDAIGWPPLQSAARMRAHPLRSQLRAYMTRRATAPLDPPTRRDAVAAIRAGVARGFCSMEAPVPVLELRAWVDEVSHLLPDAWRRGLARLPSPFLAYAGSRPADPSAPSLEGAPLRDASPAESDRTPFGRPDGTVVTHGLVAAEVDRETFNELVNRRKYQPPAPPGRTPRDGDQP